MAPDLLERQAELDTLTAALERAARGHGSTALVLGEAGIGKTSLLQAFVVGAPKRTRVLAGGGGVGRTARPVGVWRAPPRAWPGPLARALATGAEPDRVLV